MAGDAQRRETVELSVQTLQEVWSGRVRGQGAFLRPVPRPPILIAAFGPKMAELSGKVGDGICVQARTESSELATVAREVRARSGRGPGQFVLAASLGSVPEQTRSWAELGIDRLIVYVAPPFIEQIQRLAGVVSRDRAP